MLFLRLYFKEFLFTLLVLLMLTLSVLPQVQKLSYSYIDKSFDRALISFALAKGLNSLISVAQGTEIVATPAGVGVNFAIGELLDPVNDMVERFSWVMLASTVSLGIQKIFTLILGSLAIKILLSLLALLLLYAFLTKKQKLASVGLKFFIIVMILRFSMPLIALSNQALYSSFLAPSYDQSIKSLQDTSQEIQLLQEEDTEHATTVWGKIKQAYKSTAESLNIKKHMKALTDKLNTTFEHMLTLITLFIIETILFPLLFLYLLVKLLKVSNLSSRGSAVFLEKFRSKVIS